MQIIASQATTDDGWLAARLQAYRLSILFHFLFSTLVANTIGGQEDGRKNERTKSQGYFAYQLHAHIGSLNENRGVDCKLATERSGAKLFLLLLFLAIGIDLQ